MRFFVTNTLINKLMAHVTNYFALRNRHCTKQKTMDFIILE